MVKKALLIIGIINFTIYPIFSEVDIDTTIQGIITGNIEGSDEATTSGTAIGSLSVQSTGNSNVKSELLLDFTSTRDISTLSITKAYIKFRYPLFRTTIGKNRITWGDGVAFNAGDVIFDDYGTTDDIDLTADELKSLNRTMVQITYPLGRFTFLEGLYLPYDFFPVITTNTGGTSTYDYSDLGIEKQSFGGRFVSKAAGIKLETGYIYNGYDEVHKPYVSFNGTLLFDYHLSASVNITNGEYFFDDWDETLKLTSGLFYLFELENDKTLTTRLESQIKPLGDWDDDALLLYPEIAFVPNEEISLFLRSIINPLDIDVESTLGLNWKTYQGFTIGGFLSINVIEDEDINSTISFVVTHKF